MSEKAAKRTTLGKVVVVLFWAFNVVMLVVTALTLVGITQVLSDPPEGAQLLPGAENAMAGAIIALGALLFLWGFGAAILGFFMYFTRPGRV